MPTFIERILDHPDLTIDVFRDKHGNIFYEGKSTKYEPHDALSDNPWKCLLKFDIPIWEQKQLADKIKR